MSEARDIDRSAIGLPSNIPTGVEDWSSAATSAAPSSLPTVTKGSTSEKTPDVVARPEKNVPAPATQTLQAPQTPSAPAAPQERNTNVPSVPPVTHDHVVNWFTTNTPMPKHVAEAFADEVNRESSFRPDLISQDTGGPSGGLFQMHLDRLQRLQQNPNWRNPTVQYQNAWQDFNGGDVIATQHRNEIMNASTREEARELLRKYFFRPAGTSLQGSVNSTTVDSLPEYQHTQAQKQQLYDRDLSGLSKLMDEMRKEPAGSAERHKKLQDSLDKSAALQEQYKGLMQTPPQHKPTDLLGAFGSLAMLAAAIGGRRSMQPATASLQAAAGVIEGINSNNDKEYDRAFKQWSSQSKMLENIIGMQGDDFKSILEDTRLSITERHDKIIELAQLWNMGHLVTAMQAGDLDTAFKMMHDLPELKLKMELTRAQIEQSKATAEASRAHAKYYEQGGAQKSGLPQWQKDIVDRKQKEYYETHGTEMPTDTLLDTIKEIQTKPASEYQRGQLEETKRIHDARIDDMVGKREISRDRADEIKRMDSARIEEMASHGLIRQQEANERHRMDDARIEDMVDKRELSHTKAIELRRMDDARIQGMADRGEITKERAKDLHELSQARIKALERGSGETVDEETIQYWGERVRRGDTLPSTYRDPDTRRRIMVAAAHAAGIQGAPHTAGEDLANKAALRSDTMSLGQLTKIADSAEAYENTAIKNMEIVKSAMPKGIGIVGIPALDRWVQTGRVETGNPNVPAYQTALVTVANEYAKVMEGSTGSAQAVTVSAREEAARLLNQAHTREQVLNVFDVMHRDMENKKSAYKEQKGMITNRISTGGTTATPSASPTIKYDAQGNRIQ